MVSVQKEKFNRADKDFEVLGERTGIYNVKFWVWELPDLRPLKKFPRDK